MAVRLSTECAEVKGTYSLISIHERLVEAAHDYITWTWLHQITVPHSFKGRLSPYRSREGLWLTKQCLQRNKERLDLTVKYSVARVVYLCAPLWLQSGLEFFPGRTSSATTVSRMATWWIALTETSQTNKVMDVPGLQRIVTKLSGSDLLGWTVGQYGFWLILAATKTVVLSRLMEQQR